MQIYKPMKCSPNTWFDGVHHFRIFSFVLVQGGNLQHHWAHSCWFINPTFIGGTREPGGVVICVTDIDNNPCKVALYRNILISYLKEATHYQSCWGFPYNWFKITLKHTKPLRNQMVAEEGAESHTMTVRTCWWMASWSSASEV